MEPLLSVEISASYPSRSAALRDVSLEVHQGEILGLVGQSGCGKSTLALAIPRLLHLKGGKVKGAIRFQGRDLMRATEREMRAIRGKSIALILQSPISSLNPALRIGTQLSEAWTAHRGGSYDQRQRAILQALESVSIASPAEILQKYPTQLSVGQAQRILIAMAVLHNPALLVADEPTSALDVVTQSEILQLFSKLNRELGTSIIFISHDLLSVSAISHRVAVLAGGEIVECTTSELLCSNPRHPSAIELIRSIPSAWQLGEGRIRRSWAGAAANGRAYD